jgi:hypothetical protein
VVGSAACRRVLMQRSVRAVGVVVLDVFLQNHREVACRVASAPNLRQTK